MKYWRKGRTWLSLLIVLYLLVAPLPEPGDSSAPHTVPVYLSLHQTQYAFLLIPFRVGDDLRSASPSQRFTHRKTLTADAPVYTYWDSTPHPDVISVYTSQFASLFGREFQQACQLLDIPPPFPPS